MTEELDIVKLLRHPSDCGTAQTTYSIYKATWLRGLAADEIERLRAENAKMREALIWYADDDNHRYPVWTAAPILFDGGRRAKEALK